MKKVLIVFLLFFTAYSINGIVGVNGISACEISSTFCIVIDAGGGGTGDTLPSSAYFTPKTIEPLDTSWGPNLSSENFDVTDYSRIDEAVIVNDKIFVPDGSDYDADECNLQSGYNRFISEAPYYQSGYSNTYDFYASDFYLYDYFYRSTWTAPNGESHIKYKMYDTCRKYDVIENDVQLDFNQSYKFTVGKEDGRYSTEVYYIHPRDFYDQMESILNNLTYDERNEFEQWFDTVVSIGGLFAPGPSFAGAELLTLFEAGDIFINFPIPFSSSGGIQQFLDELDMYTASYNYYITLVYTDYDKPWYEIHNKGFYTTYSKYRYSLNSLDLTDEIPYYAYHVDLPYGYEIQGIGDYSESFVGSYAEITNFTEFISRLNAIKYNPYVVPHGEIQIILN